MEETGSAHERTPMTDNVTAELPPTPPNCYQICNCGSPMQTEAPDFFRERPEGRLGIRHRASCPNCGYEVVLAEFIPKAKP